MPLSRIIFYCTLIAFFLAYIVLSFCIPVRGFIDLAIGGGGRLFPWIIGIFSLGLILFDFILQLKQRKVHKSDKNCEMKKETIEKDDNKVELQDKEEQEAVVSRKQGLYIPILATLILFYELFVGWIGFIGATMMFLLVLFRLFQVKSWYLTIVLVIVVTIVIHVIFDVLFGIRMDFMGL
jgi:hypothetical protein